MSDGPKVRKVARSSVSGQFVTASFADANPDTTTEEPIEPIDGLKAQVLDFLDGLEQAGFDLVTVEAEDGESQMDKRTLTLTYTADIKLTFSKSETVLLDDAPIEEAGDA